MNNLERRRPGREIRDQLLPSTPAHIEPWQPMWLTVVAWSVKFTMLLSIYYIIGLVTEVLS